MGSWLFSPHLCVLGSSISNRVLAFLVLITPETFQQAKVSCPSLEYVGEKDVSAALGQRHIKPFFSVTNVY